MAADSSADGAGDSPAAPALRRGPSPALAAEVRDGLSRRRRELPGRFLADRGIAATRRKIEMILDDRLHRVERPLVQEWITAPGAGRTLRRLVDVIPTGATTALLLLESPVTNRELRECIVVEETADMASEGAARSSAANVNCRVVATVANPTMTIPVERCAATCFTLFGSALTRFSPVAAVRVLRSVRAAMTRSDRLLIGVDLRSMTDRQRFSSEHSELLSVWHRHALTVANRELGMLFPVESFRYACRYDEGAKRLEDGLVSETRTRVVSPIMDRLTLRAGEHIRTAVQHSYGRVMLDSMLRGVGLSLQGWYEAPDGSHGLASVGVHIPQDSEP